MSITTKELEVHNDLLGSPREMKEQLERDGYLFFRDVLDLEAVAAMRSRMLSTLTDVYEVVDRGSPTPRWNGRALTGYPGRWNGRDLPLPSSETQEARSSAPWEDFVADPRIHGFFEAVRGEPITWVPIAVYRMSAPLAATKEEAFPGRHEITLEQDPFRGRHQDGFTNEGIPFWTAWIPLAEIDERTGGVVIAPGLNRQGYLHDRNAPPRHPIPQDAVPDSAWARARVYRPGDVLIFGHQTPHAGLANESDTFRMSMDVRFAAMSEPQPLFGTLTAVDPGSVTVDTSDALVTLTVDDRSFVGSHNGMRLAPAEMADALPIGERMVIGHDRGRALSVRPQKG